jgi:hypothetical protein
MKIGRNEICPCGSGKKYKRCCQNAVVDLQTLWSVNINKIADEEQLDYRITKVFFALLDFLRQTKWSGACHGVSAILYVIYSELGFEPKLCTGIICRDKWMSGHSWIELNGKVYDAACYFPIEGRPKVMPVFNGVELDTMKTSSTLYGVSALSSLSEDVQLMLNANTTIPRVLNGDYENINGASLWNVLDNICLLAEIDSVLIVTNDYFNTTRLAEKYKDTHWTLCDQIPVLANE